MLFLTFLMECLRVREWVEGKGGLSSWEKMITFVEIVKGNPGGSNNNNLLSNDYAEYYKTSEKEKEKNYINK